MNGLSTDIYSNALLSQIPTSSRSAHGPPGVGNSSASSLKYSRRYLDWNRRTFEYHADGSQVQSFDSDKGRAVTDLITEKRKDLKLNTLYGCAPQSWCMNCVPAENEGNILALVNKAATEIIVNETRANIPRAIFMQPGNIRHDLTKGSFTLDDSYIVSPYKNKFQYLPDVPYSLVSVSL
jgi:2',3'-cyclic-nucleotide 2'-phosphodiesterase (5'-nucleotidase family)